MARGRKKFPNRKGSAGVNRNISDNFLAKNGVKEGVITTDLGIQYEVLQEGSGGFVPTNALVTVHQQVKLMDGKVISDTRELGIPDTFKLKEAIRGYHEGLLLMYVGSRYRFVIPPEIAWGKKGTNAVPPNSVIIIQHTTNSMIPIQYHY